MSTVNMPFFQILLALQDISVAVNDINFQLTKVMEHLTPTSWHTGRNELVANPGNMCISSSIWELWKIYLSSV
jgi:hypothetical protein